MISNMDDLYDYYHNSISDDEAETCVSDEIPPTSKNKDVSTYKCYS